MGVKGLQQFVDHTCPAVRVWVDLKEMAEQYKRSHPGRSPVVVVDTLACLRHWYTSEAWVHGGQWREYLESLKYFVNAFSAAGIELVFVFDGVIEQKKRDEWIKRRLRNNLEIEKIFQYIKTNACQPGREMFFIPSGLATFTRFALKSLGLNTMCSLKEADYEIASYARLNDAMAILSQDTDFLIYDTKPYLSISNLSLEKLTTVMYSRENLCHSLRLQMMDLPLLACLLGNDTVSENVVGRLKRQCLAEYLPGSPNARQRQEMVPAVAHYISSVDHSYHGLKEVERNLQHHSDESLLEKGVESYILPGQSSPWLPLNKIFPVTHQCEMPIYPNLRILQFAREKHIKAESSMVYRILSSGEVDCSNTLEDELDADLPGQAIVYRSARQSIYGILLAAEPNALPDSARLCRTVKEWFVYPGNLLQQPDLVPALPPELPGGVPDLQTLWLTEGSTVEELRYRIFLACFGVQDFVQEFRRLENPTTAAVCCLLIYITLQVSTLSLEDLDAYLAQMICVRDKPADHLTQIQVSHVDSRAVHLASLFVRGLAVLISANSACGFPFKMVDLMPWEVFDGKLFHAKYLQSHSGCTTEDLLEKNDVLVHEFQKLKFLINTVCAGKNRIVQSKPRPLVPARERPGPHGRGSHHGFWSAQPTHCPGYQGRYPQPGWTNSAQTGRRLQPRPGSYNRRPRHTPWPFGSRGSQPGWS
ncbi:constitutive coactivator of peroxisome proliferator-activated receptor gamma [Pristis pectinata]|uniref:constitutive coactivator of peroxisome proliferator-activated receptor gamma n=1 Tax=Pristis pectinata TaxID=685728 RepID=UPI00223E6DC8|nr:constitutive coactivator of peroxisome proliferator-activated receptor gamma [Pristis pectinata]